MENKDKIVELLRDALEELEEDNNSIDRLSSAIERLAKAIENRPYWSYTGTCGTGSTITYSSDSSGVTATDWTVQ